MVNEPTAQPPAMDVELRAAQLYATDPIPGATALSVMEVEAAWSELSTEDRAPWRERARQELAGYAARSGNDTALQDFHKQALVATGANPGTLSAMDLVSEPAREIQLRSMAADAMPEVPELRAMLNQAEQRLAALVGLLDTIDEAGAGTDASVWFEAVTTRAASVRELYGL